MKNKLNDALPTTTEFQDVGEMTMKMRMVKSPEELGKFTKVSFSLKHFKISFISLLHVIPFQMYFKIIFTKKDLYFLYNFKCFCILLLTFQISKHLLKSLKKSNFSETIPILFTALYRKTARIADLGGFAARESIRENVPEYQIASYVSAKMIQEIGQTFGVKSELRDTWTWLQAGPINTDGAHNPVTSRYTYLCFLKILIFKTYKI